jgi:hypothetical protein
VAAARGATPIISSRLESGRAAFLDVATEEPMNEDLSEHRPPMRTLGDFMELTPQAPSADQEPLISGNIRPWHAEDALLVPTIGTRVDELGSGESGFDQAQGRSHAFAGLGWSVRIIGRTAAD